MTSISEKVPPYYALQIQFSSPEYNQVTKYDSEVFEAQDYKWKLVVYPKGKACRYHLAFYIALEDVLQPNELVYAAFRFYLLDLKNFHHHLIRALPDSEGTKICFHRRKLEWGFDLFIQVSEFHDPSNGYLVGNPGTCVFGVEVVNVEKATITGQNESLVIHKQPDAAKYQWKIDKFSKLRKALARMGETCRRSPVFTAGNQEWKIELYPKGADLGKDSYISLYVCLAGGDAIVPCSKIYAQLTVRVLDQLKDKHIIGEESFWFDSTKSRHGWSRFVPLDYVHKYLLVKDILFVEAEVRVLAVTSEQEHTICS